MCDVQGALRCVLTVSAAYIAHDNVRRGSHHFDINAAHRCNRRANHELLPIRIPLRPLIFDLKRQDMLVVSRYPSIVLIYKDKDTYI